MMFAERNSDAPGGTLRGGLAGRQAVASPALEIPAATTRRPTLVLPREGAATARSEDQRVVAPSRGAAHRSRFRPVGKPTGAAATRARRLIAAPTAWKEPQPVHQGLDLRLAA